MPRIFKCVFYIFLFLGLYIFYTYILKLPSISYYQSYSQLPEFCTDGWNFCNGKEIRFGCVAARSSNKAAPKSNISVSEGNLECSAGICFGTVSSYCGGDL